MGTVHRLQRWVIFVLSAVVYHAKLEFTIVNFLWCDLKHYRVAHRSLIVIDLGICSHGLKGHFLLVSLFWRAFQFFVSCNFVSAKRSFNTGSTLYTLRVFLI